jgi:hypothetical protein
MAPCMTGAICGLFNLMNRLVNGLGVEAPESYTKIRRNASRMAVTHSRLIWFRSDKAKFNRVPLLYRKVPREYFHHEDAHLSGKGDPVVRSEENSKRKKYYVESSIRNSCLR